MKKSKTYYVSLISILSALTVIIGIIEIPWIVPWLKLDFSELIILIAVYFIGYFRTLPIIIIRSVIRFMLTPGTNIPFPFFGELIAIIASLLLATLFWVSLLIIKKAKDNTYKDSIFLFLMWFVIVIVALLLTMLSTFVTTPAMLSGGKYMVVTKKMFIDPPKGLIGLNLTSYRKYINYMLMLYFPFNVIKYFLVVFLFLVSKVSLDKINKIRRK